jgi:hypothetical protein
MTMSPKAAFRSTMVELWHSALTAGEIVRRYSRSYRGAFGRVFSERRLNEIWRDARGERRLPPHDARPHFIVNCSPAPIATDADPDGAADLDLDAEIGRQEMRDVQATSLAGSSELLLQALRDAHGNEPWRALDGVPPQVLKMELDGFPPSPSRLIEMARVRDVYAAQLKKRHQPQTARRA